MKIDFELFVCYSIKVILEVSFFVLLKDFADAAMMRKIECLINNFAN